MTMKNILGGIGNTPLVELDKVVPSGCARIVAKLEWANPTGSMKDRYFTGLCLRSERLLDRNRILRRVQR